MLRKQLTKLYHVLASRLGLSESDRHAIMAAYDASSSTELSDHDLEEVCRSLKKQLVDSGKDTAAQDTPLAKMQLRVKASCGHLLAAQGKIPPAGWGPKEWGIIMGTIANASGKKEFLLLTKQELLALSFEFNKQRRALETVKQNLSSQNS